MLELEACDECGALLMPPDIPLHQSWHIGQRRRHSEQLADLESVVAALQAASRVQDIDGRRIALLETRGS
jgi:hypothetical protein